MVDFKKLKNKSNNTFGQLNKAIEKLSGNSYDEEKKNYWMPTLDKDGNGSAIIRFVPSPIWFESDDEEENSLFVRTWEHSFQGPTGKWYIEKSLTTIGKDDPMTEANNKLWNTGIPANQDIVRKRKRKLYYVCNILVIKDPEKPENNGKVFLYKFGAKIMGKIKLAMEANPELDEVPVTAFDVFEKGANFRLRIKRVDKFPNYDDSSFASPSALSDEQIELVASTGHSLEEVIDPSKFKTYEELEKKMNLVLGLTSRASSKNDDEDREDKAAPDDEDDARIPWDTDEADSDLDYFKSLAE